MYSRVLSFAIGHTTMPRASLDPIKVAWVQELIPRVLLYSTRIKRICEEFGVKPRQAANYLQAARAEISKNNDISREERRNVLRAALEAVVSDANARDDGRTAVSGIRELVALDGAAEPTKVDVAHSGLVGVTIEPDPVKAAARLAELRTKQTT